MKEQLAKSIGFELEEQTELQEQMFAFGEINAVAVVLSNKKVPQKVITEKRAELISLIKQHMEIVKLPIK